MQKHEEKQKKNKKKVSKSASFSLKLHFNWKCIVCEETNVWLYKHNL